MYLIDLKEGIEMSDFEDAPNVNIVGDLADAVILLEKIEKERKSRFNGSTGTGVVKILTFHKKVDFLAIPLKL